MRTLKFIFALIIVLVVTNLGKAQDNPVLDGAFAREHVRGRQPVPLPYIREADAMWSKKILRVIQLDEKINHPLYFPITRITFPGGLQPQRNRVNLLYLIYNVGIKGEEYDKYTGEILKFEEGQIDTMVRLPVYRLNPGDITNWYREPISRGDKKRDSFLSYSEPISRLVDIEDPDGDTYEETVDVSLMDTRDMTQLWMWEEWVFDRKRSVLDVRIIAMSPDGWHGTQRIWPFWIPYPDYRALFAVNETFNPQNEAEQRTFDDIFLKRRFKSFIVAETNVFDNRLISDYLLGIDAIREGEKIQDLIFTKEHDMWEY